jgi:hypothetical protein
MGWSESPPYFCSFTGTCTDLTNHFPVDSPFHPYKHVLEPQQTFPCPDTFHEDTVWPYNPCPLTHSVTFTDSYIDDFMIAAQRPQHTPTLDTLLHHIRLVFQDPPDTVRRPVVSESKVQKGDATFSPTKCILGWDVNTDTMTIHLPVHRQEHLHTLLTSTLAKTSTT